MKKLHILIGIPGSGKSTWTEKYVKELHSQNVSPNNIVIINMDEILVEITGNASDQSRNKEVFGKATTKFRQSVNRSITNIIWDNTTVSRGYRVDLIETAKKAGYEVIGVFFNVELNEAKKRNMGRDRVVPEDVLVRMHKNLQVPSLDEGFTEIVTV